jgi:hypothetical protein
MPSPHAVLPNAPMENMQVAHLRLSTVEPLQKYMQIFQSDSELSRSLDELS